MARQTRLAVAGVAHHLIWQGLQGVPVFFDDADRQQFLRIVDESARQHQVVLHAYVLLDHHIHLLCTPSSAQALSLMMQGIGRRYVRSFNGRHDRRGPLWAGRYRCTLIEPGSAELEVMVLLDTEPVRAGLVDAPAAYAWSSHTHYLGLRASGELHAPAAYWDLANTPFGREAAYASKVAQGLSDARRQIVWDAALKGWVLGSVGFVADLQSRLGRRLRPGSPGRPLQRAAAKPQHKT